MVYEISQDIAGLIFDFDGTIVDSMPAHFLSWKAAFASFGAAFHEPFFYDNAGVSLIGVVETYNLERGTDLPVRDVVARKNALHVDYLAETRPIPEVIEIIDRYHGRLPMAVATGNARALTEPILTRLGLRRCFVSVVYGEDVANSKPHPDCFLKAARAMGVAPERCEVFEDGDPGLEGARRAGMKATDIRPWLRARR